DSQWVQTVVRPIQLGIRCTSSLDTRQRSPAEKVKSPNVVLVERRMGKVWDHHEVQNSCLAAMLLGLGLLLFRPSKRSSQLISQPCLASCIVTQAQKEVIPFI